MDRFFRRATEPVVYFLYINTQNCFLKYSVSHAVAVYDGSSRRKGRGGTRGKLDAFPIYVCTKKVPQCGYPKCETDGKEGLPLYCQLEEVTTGLKEKEKMHEKKEVAINTQVKVDCWTVNSWFFNIKKTKALS